jgi:hypothetical protein
MIRAVSPLLQGSAKMRATPCLSAPVMQKAAPGDEPPRGRKLADRFYEPTPLLGARPSPQYIEPQRQWRAEPSSTSGVVGDAVAGERVHQDVQPFAVEH